MKNMNIKITKHAGFSLIELMIAMLIGLFLLSGIATSYVSSKKSSVKTDEMTKLEDNGRLALEVLASTIQHTGYTPISNADMFDPPFILNNADVKAITCPGGEKAVEEIGIFHAARVTKDNPGGDRIAVMYHGDSRVFSDCAGGVLPVGCQAEPPSVASLGTASNKSRIYNAFFIKKNKIKINGVWESRMKLQCAGSRNKAVQTIADGIENMQFLYGLDTSGDGSANRHVNAAVLGTDPSMWNTVVSVQIAVLVRSSRPVKTKKEKITYTLLDQTYTPAKKDRYQRAVFTTSVRLRNTL